MAKGTRRTSLKDHSAGCKVLARNKKARRDYELEETCEAGIVLVGSEVKSLREAQASLVDAYAEIRGGEAWLVNAQINEYAWANQFNHEPRRTRKLLLHGHEIRRLGVKTEQRGYALVPLAIYLKEGKIKVELGLGVGRKLYEKRHHKREADDRREMAREAKTRRG